MKALVPGGTVTAARLPVVIREWNLDDEMREAVRKVRNPEVTYETSLLTPAPTSRCP